ncbi:hypothetical protein JG687_00018741 [Phytophthora cactorum]|uniref:Uncharacterized protein n=1 Tax=Phytophthora cactorum TaxID=29920 RepID=A0A8T1TLZ8_9STRA|nr:hypothetical protein JG687_00018741 [Phytophthora cactorum]
MRCSVCNVLLHHLHRSAMSNLLLDNDVGEEDNDDNLFFGVISSHRYLARPPVVKTGHWSPGRNFASSNQIKPSTTDIHQSH